MPDPLRVGAIGCGAIMRKYRATFTKLPDTCLVACADLQPERAEAVARSTPGAHAMPVAELLAAPNVDLVLNLTPPVAHAEVATLAIQAGKHTYGEKPLATSVDLASDILRLAAAKHRAVGCAPDTVLGTGLQTARATISRGDIGTPVAASAFMTSGGPDNFHPNPAFFYQPGGGPLMDMGPYYVTALITLLGPVRRVTGLTARPRAQRRIISGPNAGDTIQVAIDTHVSAILEHHSGALSTLLTTWDVPAGSTLPRIEIYGDEGTMQAPDPNQFAGDVRVRTSRTEEWTTVAPLAGYQDVERGIGVADLARRLADGDEPRASGRLALHALEVMTAILEAAESGRAAELSTACPLPDPVPLTNPAQTWSQR